MPGVYGFRRPLAGVTTTGCRPRSGQDYRAFLTSAANLKFNLVGLHTVRARPGRLSTLGVSRSNSFFLIAVLHGCAGCLTVHIGGCRPGQYPPTTLAGVGEPTVWVGDEGGVGTRDEVVDAPYRVSTWFSTQARLAAGGGVIS